MRTNIYIKKWIAENSFIYSNWPSQQSFPEYEKLQLNYDDDEKSTQLVEKSWKEENNS